MKSPPEHDKVIVWFFYKKIRRCFGIVALWYARILITYLMVRHNSPTHKKSKLNYKINMKIESFKKVELPPLLKGIRTRVHFTIYGE